MSINESNYVEYLKEFDKVRGKLAVLEKQENTEHFFALLKLVDRKTYTSLGDYYYSTLNLYKKQAQENEQIVHALINNIENDAKNANLRIIEQRKAIKKETEKTNAKKTDIESKYNSKIDAYQKKINELTIEKINKVRDLDILLSSFCVPKEAEIEKNTEYTEQKYALINKLKAWLDTDVFSYSLPISENDIDLDEQKDKAIEDSANTVASNKSKNVKDLIQTGILDTTAENEQVLSSVKETLSVGKTIKMGTYSQKSSDGKDKTPIEWKVLDVKNGKALLISTFGLNCKPYNGELIAVTWEKCSLRKWLNEVFIRNAFTKEEQQIIQNTHVKAKKNPRYNTDPGTDTIDKVFLLSIDEANTFFKSNKKRKCYPTKIARKNGVFITNNYICNWWLRSPGANLKNVVIVTSGGTINYNGCRVNNGRTAVRPAMWIDIGQFEDMQ